LFSKDVHPKFVQELVGHASVAFTLHTYSPVLPGMGDHTAHAMEETLDQDQPEEKDVWENRE
jgi:hypothetical protein